MEIPKVLTKLAGAVQRRKEHSRLYHLFLTRCLLQQEAGKGYRALVRLIRKGYFSTILTSNMDTALEDALEEEGWYPYPYEVLVIGRDANEKIRDALEGPQNGIHIVKLYGERSQNEQTVSPLGDVQTSLQYYFNQNIIIVGCMDQEEDAISALSSHKAGDMGIYYVRQNNPSSDDIVVKCLEKQGKQLDHFLITGAYGDFNIFFSELEKCIKDKDSPKQTLLHQKYSASHHNVPDAKSSSSSHTSPLLNDEVSLPLVLRQVDRSAESLKHRRTTVFISYSHNDARYLERLLIHLDYLDREGLINVWSDQKIKPGENWREEIEQAIALARTAVLLISADFLASSFITEFELPALLELSRKEGMAIMPMIISHSDYERTELAGFQAVNNPSKPLSDMPRSLREKEWKRLAKLIRTKINL